MVYKRFRFVVAVRVLLISGTLYLFFHLLFSTESRLYATIFIISLTICYQIYALIYYVEKTNRDLNRFLLTIKHEDFSQTFLGLGLGSSFDDLKKAFNEIIQKFHRTRAETEEHFRYLQTIVQHVGIGLIAFQSDGKVELFNTAAKRLLKLASLKNIRDLNKISKPLMNTLLKMKTGQKALIKIHDDNEQSNLSISATEFIMREQNFTLVSLQNIQSELEEKELEAWQQLIRVLTHEIMNSVTPIASLASTVNETINFDAQTTQPDLSEESKSDIAGALKTIQKRSEGLLHFVEAYRGLTRIPTPDFTNFSVLELIERVHQLMQTEILKKNIQCKIEIVPKDLKLTADSELVEQILINILKNAIQAIDGQANGRIDLLSKIDDRGHIIIRVTDNGPGIPKDVQDNIFIPFFTTKEEGSGIGLSLSRQIMRLHRGSISMQSKPNEATVFTLRF